ncbi:MAG: sigma D regulator [Cycloclasticus sp.]|nr:MAG: anti-sigma factor [Cycloclasticus sp. Phe_18]MBV1912458.1 sigma D regulator [Cycloclasticus sp.]MDF1689705.1 sigma D regulator [Cycloclasticus sp.]MEE4291664.1 sigma D regulator [Cycloclasticus sp.]
MSNENVVQIKERSQTSSLISELLEERKQVWSTYCAVSGIEEQKGQKSIEELLQDFCQLSVDYISLGHFGVYQRILDGNERRKSVMAAAERIYPNISKATEAVLDFNDKYQTLTPAMILNSLAADLSSVGEHLANRIELEDELIGEMLA